MDDAGQEPVLKLYSEVVIEELLNLPPGLRRSWQNAIQHSGFLYWLFGGTRIVSFEPAAFAQQPHLLARVRRRIRTGIYWWFQRTFNTRTWRDHQAWRASLPCHSSHPDARHVIMLKERR